MITDKEALKPCPFCGGKAREWPAGFSNAKVTCLNGCCEAVSVKTWQKRAPLQHEAIPEGWKLVPIEPTEEMVEAGWEHTTHPCFAENVADAYIAMIAAAPLPAQIKDE